MCELSAFFAIDALTKHASLTNTMKAMNTAVNAAVQIEPFKFFHKINESICNYEEPLQYSNSQMSNVGGSQGRSNKPAGIAHLGELCTVRLPLRCLFQMFDMV
jgi:hypothetical protein